MVEESYVSFETAKLLKEKGFDEPCNHYYFYRKLKEVHYYERNSECQYLDEVEYCTSPTQQMAMRWLREVHGLHISLEPCYDYDSMHVVFLAFVQNVTDVHEFMDGRKNVASYPNAEKSCELAIKYCLENLI